MTNTQVAVIGGGLAGLNAARLLLRANLDFLLLEARNRPGGRILSVNAEGAPDEDGFAEAGSDDRDLRQERAEKGNGVGVAAGEERPASATELRVADAEGCDRIGSGQRGDSAGSEGRAVVAAVGEGPAAGGGEIEAETVAPVRQPTRRWQDHLHSQPAEDLPAADALKNAVYESR